MDLMARLDKLESDYRQSRRMNVVALGLLCVVAVLLGAQTQPAPSRLPVPSPLMVQEITFTDQQGKPLWKISPRVEGANTTQPKSKLVFSSTLTSDRGEFVEMTSLVVHQMDATSRYLSFPDTKGEASIGVFRGARGTSDAAVRLNAYDRSIDLSSNLSEAGLHLHTKDGKGRVQTRLNHQNYPEILVENSQGNTVFQVKE